MSSPALALRLAVAALGAVAGCTIYDGREIAIERFDTQPVDQVLRLQLRGSGDRARLAIDGRDLGSFPVGPVLSLDVSGLSEEEHLLEARLESGRSPSPAQTRFLVDRGPPRLVSVQPPPGKQPPGPLSVELTFSKAVGLDQAVAVDGVAGVDMDGVPTAGGKGWRVTQAHGVAEDHVQLTAVVTVSDRAGRRVTVDAGPYRVPRVRVVFDEPAGPGLPWVAGTVRVAVRGLDYDLADPPPRAQLLAGGLLVAELGPLPWPAIDWDTGTAPEGSYRLEVKVPGHHVVDGVGPAVVLDRTRPVITCEPEGWAREAYPRGGCLRMRASEYVTGPSPPVLRAAGVPVLSSYGYPDAAGTEICPLEPTPAGPYALGLDVTGLADESGLPAVTQGCDFAVPIWGARVAGPLATSAGTLLASRVAFGGKDGDLAWIPAAGAANEDKVHANHYPLFTFGTPALLGSGVASQVVSCGPASGLLAWTETAPGGGTRVAMAQGNFLNEWTPVRGLEAFGGGRSPACLWGTLVWSEPDGGGRRDLRTAFSDGTAIAPWGSGVRAELDAEADGPSIAANDAIADVPWLLAFLETRPGGAARVRAATGRPLVDAGWTQVAGSLNRDPAAGASEPVAWSRQDAIVAWVEAGQVLARVAPGAPGVAPFGAAAVLNADPAKAARSPRLVDAGGGALAVWVETGASGDEIRASRWDGTSWALLPDPVNAGVPGDVRWLAAAPGPEVLWVLADGTVRVRIGNL